MTRATLTSIAALSIALAPAVAFSQGRGNHELPRAQTAQAAAAPAMAPHMSGLAAQRKADALAKVQGQADKVTGVGAEADPLSAHLSWMAGGADKKEVRNWTVTILAVGISVLEMILGSVAAIIYVNHKAACLEEDEEERRRSEQANAWGRAGATATRLEPSFGEPKKPEALPKPDKTANRDPLMLEDGNADEAKAEKARIPTKSAAGYDPLYSISDRMGEAAKAGAAAVSVGAGKARKAVAEKTAAYRTPRRRDGETPNIDEIKGLRQALGLTQRELAAEIGCTVRAVENWEQGERSPEEPEYVEALKKLRTKARTILKRRESEGERDGDIAKSA